MAALDTSNYISLILPQDSFAAIHERLQSWLSVIPITSSVINQLVVDIERLQVTEREYAKAINDEIKVVPRLNRTPEDITEEVAALVRENRRISEILSVSMRHVQDLKDSFFNARNRDSILANSTANTTLNTSIVSGPAVLRKPARLSRLQGDLSGLNTQPI